MFTYRAVFEPFKSHEGEGFTVYFPEVPGATTQGDTREEAIENAVDALETMLGHFVDEGRDLPSTEPTSAAEPDEMQFRPSLHAFLKLSIYRAMRQQGVRKADLARRLGVKPPEADRILDLSHETRLDRLEDSLKVLDCKLSVDVQYPELLPKKSFHESVKETRRALGLRKPGIVPQTA